MEKSGVSLPADLALRLQELRKAVPVKQHTPNLADARFETTYAHSRSNAEPIDVLSMSVRQLADLMLRAADFTTPDGHTAADLELLVVNGKGAQLVEAIELAAGEYQPRTNEAESAAGISDVFPDRAARFLRAVAEKDKTVVRDAILRVWDKLEPIAVNVVHGGVSEDSRDELAKAINHPAGQLAQALFALLLPEQIQRDTALDRELTSRVEGMLASAAPGARAYLPIVSSRLYSLHVAQEAWTAEWLLPRFNWSNVDSARAAWQGFLWAPRLDASLSARLHDSFLEAFKHHEDFVGVEESLCGVLVDIALYGTGVLKPLDTRRAILAMPPAWRATTAWLLGQRLDDAKGGESGADHESAARLARERVIPWLAQWPQDVEVWRDNPRLADRLVGVALRSGSAFPEAVAVLRKHQLGVGQHSYAAQLVLRDYESLIHRFAADVACLYDRVLPTKRECQERGWIAWCREDLEKLIELLRAADPTIETSQCFRGLHERL